MITRSRSDRRIPAQAAAAPAARRRLPFLALAATAAIWCGGVARVSALNVLLVTLAPTPSSSENARKTQFEGWGHTVTTIADESSQSAFDTAMSGVDVVYIPMTVEDWILTNKCKNTTKGVVCEERYLDDDMGFSTGTGWDAGHNQTEILDNTHSVTTGLSTGYVTIVSSSQQVALMNPTVASGMTVLSKQNYSAGSMLGVMEVGASLAGGGTAAGRRVRLPWGGDSFSWSALNSNGLKIAQQAIAWAGADTSLMLHWKLDATAGTVLTDSSGSGRHGAFNTGTPAWVDGRRYKALQFNGSNDADSDANFDPPATGTVAFWFRGNGTPGSIQRITGITSSWEITYRTDGKLGFNLGNSSGPQSTTVFSAANDWRHVAAVYNSSADTYKIYVNGVLDASGSATLADQGAGILSLGTRTGSTNRFNGAVDDFRIYSKELTAAEIAELYGLVGHWKLDETAGTTVADSSGAGNNGTVVGTATWTEGARRNGFSANYANGNDYVQIANSTSLENVQEGSYSLAAWFKPNNLPPGTGSDNNASYGIIRKEGWHLGIVYNNEGNFYHEHWIGATPTWSGAGSWSYNAPGKFYHVVAVVDRDTGSIKFYLNGELAQTSSFTAGTSAWEYGTNLWRIGVSNPSGGTYAHPANGVLDDVRIYNRVIDDAEIAELYGLVGHWKFDEAAGTTAADSSPAGNTGTHVNGPTVNQSGVYSKSVLLDGVNDYVSVPAAKTLEMTEDCTVALWVKPGDKSGVERTLLSKEGEYKFALSSLNELKWSYANTTPGWNWYSTGVYLADNEWSHVVFSYTLGTVKTYVNGVLRNTYAGSGTIGDQASDDVLRIGATTATPEKFCNGHFDDVRVYNRVLTQLDVYDLYGLAAWYKLDEPSGTLAADATGQGNDGTYVGSPTLGVTSTGRAGMGTAIALNGTNYVEIPLLVGRTSSVSVAGWAKLDSADSVGAEIVSIGDYFLLRLNTSGSLTRAAYYNGSSWVSADLTGSMTKSGWHHFAASLAAGETIKLYIDGNEVASTSAASAISYSGLGSVTRIGRHGHTSNSSDFTGRIDDVRIYSRAMTPEEVFTIYRGGRIDGLKILRWVEAR
ncbi:MAG: LamG domain-containing protein [Pirellulales bacterium]|nr:LamG domain-containing protein [Pirellulales bacterium]